MESESLDDAEVETPMYTTFRRGQRQKLLLRECGFWSVNFIVPYETGCREPGRVLEEPRTILCSRSQSLGTGLLQKARACRTRLHTIFSLHDQTAS